MLKPHYDNQDQRLIHNKDKNGICAIAEYNKGCFTLSHEPHATRRFF